MHEVLVNRLGGLSLPRKSVVRLTDRPDKTLDVYRGRKTTIQQQQQHRRSPICTRVSGLILHFERPKSDPDLSGVASTFLIVSGYNVPENPNYSRTSMARTPLGP